jgi:hypothetical protein
MDPRIHEFVKSKRRKAGTPVWRRFWRVVLRTARSTRNVSRTRLEAKADA